MHSISRLNYWLRRSLQVLAVLVMALHWNAGTTVMAQEPESAGNLPVLSLDAIDPSQWSDSSLAAAPGQTIRVTNRGVLPHTFVIPEWGVRVELPTLEAVDVIVPESAEIGQSFDFFCDEPGHADAGMRGSILVVSAENARTGLSPGSGGAPSPAAVTLLANDNLTWAPNALELSAGQILQVQNPGVIEHHFVVDEWGINETISAGETVLVRVPPEVIPGTIFTFYCSVPGHRAAGMEGTITIIDTGPPPSSSGGPGSNAAILDVDIRQFVPNAGMLGEGWSEVRSGNVRSIVPEWGEINVTVFPGDGIGVVFVGPSGSRAAVAVLPLETIAL
ncbi:MAG: plastocyanin/azurin family copper-binding protein, partial [Thermomicrobiales bacterium]